MGQGNICRMSLMFNALLPPLAQEESGDGGVRTYTFHRRSADAPRSVSSAECLRHEERVFAGHFIRPSASLDKVTPPSSRGQGSTETWSIFVDGGALWCARAHVVPFPAFNDSIKRF